MLSVTSQMVISKVSDMKVKALFDNKETPYLELSLKRLIDVGDTGTSAHDRNILRHSGLSAFSRYKDTLKFRLDPSSDQIIPQIEVHNNFLTSRYNSASITSQAPTRNDGSCSPLDNSPELAKTESVQNFQSDSNGTRPDQGSNGSSDNNDMGFTTNNVFSKQVAVSDMPAPKSTVKSLHPSAFQPVQSGHISPPQPIIQGKTDAAIASTDLSQERHINQPAQVQHHHHHYNHHHHHVHNNMPQKQLANPDDLSLKKITTAAPHCGSSNLLSPPLEGNGQSGSTTAINAGGANMESDNGIAGKGGASGVIGFASRSGDDLNRSAQREAALNKFRLKRKERCFEKKVTEIVL
jgi:pseudo-response regulator 7